MSRVVKKSTGQVKTKMKEKSTFCANCGQLINENEIVHHLSLENPQIVANESNLMDIKTVLNKIYNLDYIKKSFPQDDPEVVVMCGQCHPVLHNLFKFYDQFNHLRQVDSYLDKQIQNLDSLLHQIEFQDNSQSKSHDDASGGEDMSAEEVNSGADDDYPTNIKDSLQSEVVADSHDHDNKCKSSDHNISPVKSDDEDDASGDEDTNVNLELYEVKMEVSSTEEVNSDSDEDDYSSDPDDPTCDDANQFLQVQIAAVDPGQEDRNNSSVLLKFENANLIAPSPRGELRSAKVPRLSQSEDVVIKRSQKVRKFPSPMMSPLKKMPNKFDCTLCKSTMENSKELLTHYRRHHKGETRCRLCPKVCSSKKTLSVHLVTHIDDKPYHCPMTNCKWSFRRKLYIPQHFHKIHKGESFEDYQHLINPSSTTSDQVNLDCEKCRKNFSSLRILQAHQKICHLISIKCPLCPHPLFFQGKIKLGNHLWEHHVDKNQTDCPLCDKKYSESSKLKGHILFAHIGGSKTGTLQCQKCPAKFHREHHLKKHMKSVHVDGKQLTPKVNRCSICSKTFSKKDYLNVHMRRHNQDFRYPCTVPGCKKAFVVSNELTLHVKTVHFSPTDELIHTCNICGKGFHFQHQLNRHVKSHLGKPFKCLQCHRRFPTQLAEKHVEGCKGPTNFVCDICGKILFENHALQSHMKIHMTRNVMTCPAENCGKKFMSKSGYDEHVILHDKEKALACLEPNCPKLFATKSALNNHVGRVHPHLIVEKGIKVTSQLCPVCGVTFVGGGASTLKKHMMMHSGDRPFKCHLCPKAFNSQHNLKRHLDRHEGNRTLACTHEGCSKSFYLPFELKKHLTTHTGERKFLCPICGKGSYDSGNHNKHMLIHSNVRQFQCQFCDKAFKQPQMLKTHEASHKK